MLEGGIIVSSTTTFHEVFMLKLVSLVAPYYRSASMVGAALQSLVQNLQYYVIMHPVRKV